MYYFVHAQLEEYNRLLISNYIFKQQVMSFLLFFFTNKMQPIIYVCVITKVWRPLNVYNKPFVFLLVLNIGSTRRKNQQYVQRVTQVELQLNIND